MGTLRQVGIEIQALDNLRYIRQTMECAGSFTAVPGRGGMWMGVTAAAAALLAGAQTNPTARLAVWLAAAFVALVIGITAARRKVKMSENSGPARKFALALMPALFAGAVLTLLLVREGLFAELPPLWLLLYGTAVVSGALFPCAPFPPWASGFWH